MPCEPPTEPDCEAAETAYACPTETCSSAPTDQDWLPSTPCFSLFAVWATMLAPTASVLSLPALIAKCCRPAPSSNVMEFCFAAPGELDVARHVIVLFVGRAHGGGCFAL